MINSETRVKRAIIPSSREEMLNQLRIEAEEAEEEKRREEELKQDAISEQASYAAQVRHAKAIKNRLQAIEHYKKEHEETGISKNQFSKKYHAQYGISEKTMRTKWLQAYENKRYFYDPDFEERELNRMKEEFQNTLRFAEKLKNIYNFNLKS